MNMLRVYRDVYYIVFISVGLIVLTVFTPVLKRQEFGYVLKNTHLNSETDRHGRKRQRDRQTDRQTDRQRGGGGVGRAIGGPARL